jgi:uncharacterized protein with beta-barrel porin domain
MMTQESDGISEIFEHTLQVATGILNEHGRGIADRRAAAAREQATRLRQGTAITDAQATASHAELSGELAQVAQIAGLSNARPVTDAVANGPRGAPAARRARAGRQPAVERERGR